MVGSQSSTLTSEHLSTSEKLQLRMSPPRESVQHCAQRSWVLPTPSSVVTVANTRSKYLFPATVPRPAGPWHVYTALYAWHGGQLTAPGTKSSASKAGALAPFWRGHNQLTILSREKRYVLVCKSRAFVCKQIPCLLQWNLHNFPGRSYDRAFGLRLLCPPQSFCDANQSELLDDVLPNFLWTLISLEPMNTPCRKSPAAVYFREMVYPLLGCYPMFWRLPRHHFDYLVRTQPCPYAQTHMVAFPFVDEKDTQMDADNHKHFLVANHS